MKPWSGRANWAQFGAAELEQIAEEAALSSAHPWVSRAWKWLHGRLGSEVLDGLPGTDSEEGVEGPPETLYPIVGVKDGRGLLGFLRLVESPTTSDPVLTCLSEILYPVMGKRFLLGRSLLIEGEPEGGSEALATFVAGLSLILDLKHGHATTATGAFKNGEFGTVNEHTIIAKIEAAQRFGYKRMIVVEGQGGIPQELEGFVVRVPTDPVLAMPAILELIETDDRPEAMALVLSAFDQAKVRTCGGLNEDSGKRVLQVLDPFIAPRFSKLTRFVAHDLRSRVLLHLGKTEQAHREDVSAEEVRPKYLPDSGWLLHYLKWHRIAHRSVLLLDQGHWCDDDSAHRKLDCVLQSLSVCETRAEALARLYLRNARARRWDFLGRLRGDKSLLRDSFEEYTRNHEEWQDHCDYAKSIGLDDGDIRRQENQAMDPMVAIFELEGALDRDLLGQLRFWPSHSYDPKKESPFDLVAGIRWLAVTDVEKANSLVPDVLARLEVDGKDKCISYPWFLAYESILRHDLGGSAAQGVAVVNLLNVLEELESKDSGSVLGILALRTRRLLELAGADLKAALAFGGTSPLSDLAEDLLSEPSTLVRRCPY